MKRIVLIDDEEIANYLHELVIKKMKIFEHINVCSSGLEALSLLEEIEHANFPAPEIILLDINMPRMNGYEFLDEFMKRKGAFNEHIKVIMLTSSLNDKDRQRALEYECVVDFCSKPLSTDMIHGLLEKHYPENMVAVGAL